VVLGIQSVAEVGKEFLNHAVGEEGHLNSCRIVRWSERTSSPINVRAERGCTPANAHELYFLLLIFTGNERVPL